MRLAQDLLFFAYRDFTNAADVILEELGLGRAHHRALHFIGRNPGITVSRPAGASCASPSSRLARVLNALVDQGYVAQAPGRERPPPAPADPDASRARRWSGGCSSASASGWRRPIARPAAQAVEGFRRVMRGIMDDDGARLYRRHRDRPTGPR